MSSGSRLQTTPTAPTMIQAQSRGFLLRPSRVALVFLLIVLSLASGCAKKVRPYSAKEAVEALTAHAQKVQTVRGRAWVSARTPEQKISFPAIVVIDRTDPKAAKLRIEANDPFGSTHSLMILEDGKRFTWVDFDSRQIYEIKGAWYGLPLTQLPELLVGIATLPEEGGVSSADEDGFEVRAGKNLVRYGMKWIDPGPRLALARAEGEVERAANQREQYFVEYSKFMDKPDFYLPQEVRIKGYDGSSGEKPMLELSIAWRERTWNEKVPREAFRLPANLKGFQKQKL